MAWSTPQIVEVCVGMEVTSYVSAEIWRGSIQSASEGRESAAGSGRLPRRVNDHLAQAGHIGHERW
jgi:coenzyme PQQ precursor peptide PqqA